MVADAAKDLATLASLLDEALALAPADVERWLAALPAEHARLAPRLRAMLERRRAAALTFLADGPAFDAEDAPVAASDTAGDRIGPYRLVEPIGRGGMGEVWLARRDDGIFDRDVALKLPKVAAHGGDLAARMVHERRIAARLEHPNIARLYDAGVDGVRPWIALERVQGPNVLAHVRGQRDGAPVARTRAEGEACVDLVLQACDAIAHAHRQLVVHRDVKPANMLVGADGTLKLLDFGIARQLGVAADGLADTLTDAHTRTPRYAAPEQIAAGAAVGTATDQYALARVLLELLTGDVGPDVDAAASRAVRGVVAPELRAVLARALAADPSARYPSVDHFADDLRRVRAALPPQGAATPPRRRALLFVRRRRLPLLAAAVVALVVAAAGARVWQARGVELQQLARAQQAKEFLFDVIEHALPEAGGADGGGARAAIDAAVVRARSSFAGQPALQAQVLGELGIMLRNAGDSGAAVRLQRDGLALLEHGADAADVAHGWLHAQLASSLLTRGEDGAIDQARHHAQQALARCADDDRIDCRKARSYAWHALSLAAHGDGDVDAAVHWATQSAQATEQAFGRRLDTAVAWDHLARLEREAGRFDEAMRRSERSAALAAELGAAARHRHSIELTRAALLADVGAMPASVEAFGRLLEAPLPPEDRDAVRRLLGHALVTAGRAAEALAVATAAAAVEGRRDELEQARLGVVEVRALLALGRLDEADLALQRTSQALQRQGVGPDGFEARRCRRLGAQLQAARGDLDGAMSVLGPWLRHYERADPRREPLEAAAGYALAADTLLRRGDVAPSVAMLARAQALTGALREDHPLRRELEALRLRAAGARVADGGERVVPAQVRPTEEQR